MRKRIFSILLAALMCLALLPSTTVFAADDDKTLTVDANATEVEGGDL